MSNIINKDNLPKGICIRKNKESSTLQIFFSYKGMQCRETLKLSPTVKHIQYAQGLKLQIDNEIVLGKFDYSKYFPDSPKAKKFFGSTKVSILQLLEKQLSIFEAMTKNKQMSHSTLNGYRKIINYDLIPCFGDFLISDLTTLHIKNWLDQQSAGLKTIKNKLSLLRMTIKDAIADGYIEKDPITGINERYFKSLAKESTYIVEPFNEAEKELIINNATGQVKNLIQFGFWTGLRTSELIALKWSDVDLENGLIHIKQAKVLRVVKGPKSKAGIRTVILLPKSKTALLQQKEYTFTGGEEVFHNPNSNQPWSTSTKVGDAWRKVLNIAGVKYRNSYQMRHTYASTLLSNGENISWLVTQMGHADTQMLRKVYAKWIPQNEKSGYKFVGEY